MADQMVHIRFPVDGPNWGIGNRPFPWGGNMEHWCSGSTPAFQAGIAGSNPVCSSSGDDTLPRHGESLTAPFLS